MKLWKWSSLHEPEVDGNPPHLAHVQSRPSRPTAQALQKSQISHALKIITFYIILVRLKLTFLLRIIIYSDYYSYYYRQVKPDLLQWKIS